MAKNISFNLDNTFVALDDQCGARPLRVTGDFWNDLVNGRLGEFSRMVALFYYDKDWSTWEKHPAGEEIVFLLEGSVTLRLELENEVQELHLNESGQYAIIPSDTWHTALINSPSKMIFITPGEGTENRPL